MSAVEIHSQIALPTLVNVDEIARKQSLGSAIELCAELAGYALDKQLIDVLKVDKAQLSRWQNGTEGISWPKFVALMDACGNDVPVLWMLHQRGWDLYSLRKRETEMEKRARLAEERATAAEFKVKVLTEALHGRVAA